MGYEVEATKFQYQQESIITPNELHALGFRFTCWKIVDIYKKMQTTWRVNCLNKLDGSTATRWFDNFDSAHKAIDNFKMTSDEWDFN